MECNDALKIMKAAEDAFAGVEVKIISNGFWRKKQANRAYAVRVCPNGAEVNEDFMSKCLTLADNITDGLDGAEKPKITFWAKVKVDEDGYSNPAHVVEYS